MQGKRRSWVYDPSPMRRIVVIGPPGAGKSTIATRLGQLLDIEVFHLDELYWQRGAPLPRDEWNAVERDLIERESWVIDGNYSQTLPARVDAANAAVFLDLPTSVCLLRFIRRRLAYRKGGVPGMTADKRPYVDWAVLRQIRSFRRDHRRAYLRILAEKGAGRRIVILRTARQVRKFMADIQPTSVRR
jgi:adenylate kinase family enzyme